MSDFSDIPPTIPIDELCALVRTTSLGDDRFRADGSAWHGDRVFGGVVAAQALDAACRTVDGEWQPHSLHASFLGPVRTGELELQVERVRDGRTFTTRWVSLVQAGRETTRATISFHRAEEGPEYQLGLPSDLPPPDACEIPEAMSIPVDIRWIGPTEQRADGSYRSTRRTWMRIEPDSATEELDHRVLGALISDMTGTSFRPNNLGEWGTHTDASIDHAVWFHRPFRMDQWLYSDFHTVASTAGRTTVRGEWFQDGLLVMSMAQELLVRPLG